MAMYDSSWLEYCLRELDLPGSPWHEVKDLISKRLAERIRLEGLTYTQLTNVSKFVGKDFIKSHNLYESVKQRNDSHDEFRRLQTDREVQIFLKELTVKAAKDAACPMRQDKQVAYPKTFQDFTDLTSTIVSLNIDKKRKASSRKHLHADFGSLLDLGKDVNATDEIIVNILQVDPQQIETVIIRMKGKVLPVQLRKYLYRLQLLKAKKLSTGDSRDSPGIFQVEDEMTQQKIRKQFAQKVKLGLQELKLQQPTKSPLKQVIKSSVVEAFNTCVGLKEFSQNINLQLETSHVLNILYTHSRKFEYYYVLWVLPLQASVYTDMPSREHEYDLAMWAHLLITELLPGWPVINEIALSVWSQLAAVNKLFDDKLKNHLWTLGIRSTTGDLHAALGTEKFSQRSFDGLGSLQTLYQAIHSFTMITKRKIVHLLRRNPTTAALCAVLVLLLLYTFFTRLDQGKQIEEKEKRLWISQNGERSTIDVFLMVLVMTGPNNIDRRNAIRNTWLAAHVGEKQDGYSEIRYRFVIGVKNLPQSITDKLSSENKEYGDLLLLEELEDSYKKLSTKLGLMCEWLQNNIKFAFMLKVDDDTFVRLDKVQWDLKMDPYKYVPTLYWGYFYGKATVKQSGQWKETEWKLCDYYLPYARGGGYVIAFDLVKFVGNNWRMFQTYLSEDVTLGAWLAPLKLTRVHDFRFDTEYKTRGCKNQFIISHKQSIDDMNLKHQSLQSTGDLCEKEVSFFNGYEYNWNVPPSKCCVRSDGVP
uniref:Beta-1,3-galactosyltransferase 6 n=1 Tax=Phallusia mammillata TaxID=59560 RepID=A0A6F9D6K8_9ASCI|nr:beta-1,3-galactosyltransferase 6 [Phallusia mammillata]